MAERARATCVSLTEFDALISEYRARYRRGAGTWPRLESPREAATAH